MLGTGMPHSGVMTKNSGNTGFSSAQSRLTGLTGRPQPVSLVGWCRQDVFGMYLETGK